MLKLKSNLIDESLTRGKTGFSNHNRRWTVVQVPILRGMKNGGHIL